MRRWVLGAVVTCGGIGALAAVMVPVRTHLSIATPALVLVVPVVAGVAAGGLSSGVVAVAAGFLTYDVLFIPPYGTLAVGSAQNWVALGVYVVVMFIVARVVAFLQRTRIDARRDEDATRRLYELSDLLIGGQPVTGVLQVIADTIHQAFGVRWAGVLVPAEGATEGGTSAHLVVAATAGEPLSEPELASLSPAPGRAESLHWAAGAGDSDDGMVRLVLAVPGRPLGLVAIVGAELDRHQSELLQTYANQAALALERSQLREKALRNELLEQVDSLRASLIGAVSHDLRTPLASVKTAVTALRHAEGDGALAPAARQELLALIEHQSDALDRLVANLLDMTRIQSGALELRRAITPVAEVVDGGLRASAVAPDTVQVELPSDLPPVDVDPLLMEQVLANLLDNASRHSPDATPVRVAATVEGDLVQLSVSDQGPGIAPEDRERVFTMFSRVGGTGRAGLGLAIARAFVDAHEQRITVDDAPGGGARFIVTLSAAPGPVEGEA